MVERYDLHTHFFTNWKKGKFSLERAPRNPNYILDAVRKAGLDGVVLANAGASGGWKDAYEEFSETAKDKERLGEYKLVRELKNAIIFEDEKGLLKIIKGQEVLTEGHILAIGLNYGEIIPSRVKLESALKQIINIGAISSAAHPFGFLGIGKENLERYKERFNVFELNQNYEHILLQPKLGINPSTEEADKLAKKLGLNWVPVSDCHNRRDLGNGHIKVESNSIDFSSSDNLKDSLKEVLKYGKQKRFIPVIRKPNSLISVMGHMLIGLYDLRIRNKLGWTSLESY